MRTAAVLATALVVGLLGPAAGAAAPADRVTASASVPGKGYDAQTVVMPRGTATVTYSSTGLTKHVIGARSVKRLGTAKVSVPRYPYGEQLLVHPAGGFVYLTWDDRIQIFDVSGRTPRLVRDVTADRLFPDMIRPRLISAAFDPEGRRLLVSSVRNLRVLGTKHPARPTVGAISDLPEIVWDLAVTPDGSGLVTAGSDSSQATVAVYSLPRVGPPTLERQGTVSVPGWPAPNPDGWSTSADDVVPAPDGQSAYISVETWGWGDTPDAAVLKIRLRDLSSVALPTRGAFRTPFLQDVSANGKRVYLTYGATTDEDDHRTRALAWANGGLTATHDAGRVGDVLATAVSKAGPTQGLVYVVVKTKRGLQLRAVKVG